MNKKITYEECMSVAKKYDNKSDFRNNDYNMCRRLFGGVLWQSL